MCKNDVYLYGMTLVSTMHLLEGQFPKPDTYSEIRKSYVLPGGETGSCAVVLAALGCKVKLDGNFQGRRTIDILKRYLADIFGIDMSGVYYDPDFDGLEDMIMIAANTRNGFGRFCAFYEEKRKRWNKPQKQDIIDAKVVGLDPFFGQESEQVALCCQELGKKYVVIDCKPDSLLHGLSEITIISNEFIQENFSDINVEELFKVYTDNSGGLVIFTFGSKEIIYGRKNGPVKRFKPYNVTVESTLGAGDSFKAGAIYGLLMDMSDEDIVKFSAATAATVCSKFPLALNPPSLDKINELINMV